jgi:hypothetical protein
MMSLLRMAETQAQDIKQAMREQRVSFGLAFNHFDDDIAQLLKRLQYMTLLAQRLDASRAGRTQPPGSSDAEPA